MEKIFLFLQAVLLSPIFSVNNQTFLQAFRQKCSLFMDEKAPISNILLVAILNSLYEKEFFFLNLFQIFSAKPDLSEYFLRPRLAGSTTFSTSDSVNQYYMLIIKCRVRWTYAAEIVNFPHICIDSAMHMFWCIGSGSRENKLQKCKLYV